MFRRGMVFGWNRGALSGGCVLGEELPGLVARCSSLDPADGWLVVVVLLLLLHRSMLTAAECHAHEDARYWAGQGVSVAIQVRLVHGLMAQHPQQKRTAVPAEGEKREGPKATHGWAAGWTVMQRFQWAGRPGSQGGAPSAGSPQPCTARGGAGNRYVTRTRWILQVVPRHNWHNHHQ